MAQIPTTKIRRKVILIKGFSRGKQEQENDAKCIENYKSFFQSYAGGAYDDCEIDILKDISADKLKTKYEDEIFDFVVIILLGHGATQENYQLFELNKNELICPGQIKVNAKKLLIILESCRNLVSGFCTTALSDKLPAFEGGGKFYHPISRQGVKTLYNKQIKKCSDGTVICFACSKGEKATNDYFSKCLIQYASSWHKDWRNRSKILKVTELMTRISACVKILTQGQQNPEISGNIDFPIAVNNFD